MRVLTTSFACFSTLSCPPGDFSCVAVLAVFVVQQIVVLASPTTAIVCFIFMGLSLTPFFPFEPRLLSSFSCTSCMGFSWTSFLLAAFLVWFQYDFFLFSFPVGSFFLLPFGTLPSPPGDFSLCPLFPVFFYSCSWSSLAYCRCSFCFFLWALFSLPSFSCFFFFGRHLFLFMFWITTFPPRGFFAEPWARKRQERQYVGRWVGG